MFFLSLLNIIALVETEDLCPDDSENEIMLKLWIHLVDAQFRSSQAFRCRRGEITSTASSARRNQQLQNERKAMRKRGDLIVRAGENEFAYGEASLKSSDTDKKNRFDSKLKTVKTMKDIVHQQLGSSGSTSHLQQIKSQVQAVGYQFSRHTLTVMYLDFVGNYCCRLRKIKPTTFINDKNQFLPSFISIFKKVNQSLVNITLVFKLLFKIISN